MAVFNAPTALNHSTASAALLFMLALAKRLPDQERIVRQGHWDQQAAVLGSEIQGRTLGIVGLGRTGRELVRLVAPFAMRILAYSPHADPAVARSLGVELTSLEEVFAGSDFVSLHCRLTAATRRLIGAPQLALMKPTAFLINVARGELVDQQALVAALRDRKIAGAGLDVFDVEPLPWDDPLVGLDNVILTPHWLASTSEVWQATGEAMAEGMLRAARGERPDNVLNPEVFMQPSFIGSYRDSKGTRERSDNVRSEYEPTGPVESVCGSAGRATVPARSVAPGGVIMSMQPRIARAALGFHRLGQDGDRACQRNAASWTRPRSRPSVRSDPLRRLVQHLGAETGIAVFDANRPVAERSDVLVLAVKPQTCGTCSMSCVRS